MLNHYCAITRVDYKEFRQCLEKEQSALRSHAPAAHTALAGACPVLVLMCALLASCCRQTAALLPKLIARMRVQQQQKQQQQQPFVEKKKRQIEFAALALVMTTASKYRTAISAMLLNGRMAAFALLLGILLMLQYALERNYRGTRTFPPPPKQGQLSARMATNKMENFYMQRTMLQLRAGSMRLREGHGRLPLQQPATLYCNGACYCRFNITIVATSDMRTNAVDNNATLWQLWHAVAQENATDNNNARHAIIPISTVQQRLPQCNTVNYRSLSLERQFLCIFFFIISCVRPQSSGLRELPGALCTATTANIPNKLHNANAPTEMLLSASYCNHFRHQQTHRRSSQSPASH